jgi:GR25 family glycosyltransferase involved in LPS biosynthesis
LYYINLNRRPDRNENFLNECAKENLPKDKIIRFEAIDGKTYQFNTYENMLFDKLDSKGSSFAPNIMGNQLSHYYILKEMIEKKYNYIIICKDDVIFRNNFTKYLTKLMDSIPEDAEIINIGIHEEACCAHFVKWEFNKDDDILDKNWGKKYNDNICILSHGVNPCSLAYIVTQKGANNLIEYFEKIGFLKATDWNYNDYLESKNIFYASNTALCTGDPIFGSDIFTS